MTNIPIWQRVSSVPVDKLVDLDDSGSKHGRPCIPLLKKLTQRCYLPCGPDDSDDESGSEVEDDTGRKIRFRCLGVTKSGGRCPTSWGSRGAARILRHAKCCKNLPPELRAAATGACAESSPVPVLEKTMAQEKEVARPAVKRIRLEAAQEAVIAGQKTLDDVVKPVGTRVNLQNLLDAAILILICTGGIPPTIADSDEWKTAWLIASNHKYRPASSDTLADRLIPSEAARVREEMLKVLRSPEVEYVTIGFDSGATVGRDSFTTIHATTADRRTFFLDGECTTGVEHTGKQYADTLEPASIASLKLVVAYTDIALCVRTNSG